MENFTAALNVLYDEILLLRSEGLEFPTEAVALCDKMNFKQVKINASTELMERQRMLEEEKNRDRAVLVNQQLEFLLQDSSSTSLSKELQRYMQGSEESKQRVVAAVARRVVYMRAFLRTVLSAHVHDMTWRRCCKSNWQTRPHDCENVR